MKRLINFRRGGNAVSVLKHNTEFLGNAFLPQKALVPLTIDGVRARQVVSYGQYVREGEIIARAVDMNATNVHAPIPGIVGNACAFKTDYGSYFECLPILLEGQFNLHRKLDSNYPWRNTSLIELLHIIESKSLIVTEKPFASLATKLREAVRLNIRNLQFALFDFDKSCGLEGELLKNFLFEILEGLAIIARILESTTVEIFYTDVIAKGVKEKILQIFDFTEVVFIYAENTYPFYDITKTRAKQNFIVLPSTAIYVYEAIVKNRPFVSSYVLFSGRALIKPQLLKVRFGTLIGSLLEECGGVKFGKVSLVINGFLNGVLSESFDTPINKTIKSITVVPSKVIEKFVTLPCNNCGMCLNVCPMGLDPAILISKIKKNNLTEDDILQLKACIKCNLCSSCCSSRIPVADLIAKAKEKIEI
ncbi:MAG: hypothetical protein P1P64_00300 [Treponemataceae bacterium]